MDAVYCDKCHELNREEFTDKIVISGLHENETVRMDLCDDCKANLELWTVQPMIKKK